MKSPRFESFALIIQLVGLFLGRGTEAEELRFPPGFEWCVTTAAHQVEGGNFESDWWDFESSPGNIKNGERSGAACDHWNRLEEDTRLLSELNVSRYRFSIEWAKIEPREGEWDFEAVWHYKREIRLLKERGIEPMITLQHFTLPRWVARRGAWEWDGFPDAFARYVRFVYSSIGPGVRDWITFNEPMVLIGGGYITGDIPPGRKNVEAAGRAFVGMLRAHAEAYHALHQLSDRNPIRVGFAHHLRVFDARYWLNPLDHYAAYKLDEVWNWAFAQAPETGVLDIYIPFFISVKEEIPGLKGTQDFVGVNYYTRDRIHFSLSSFQIEKTVTSGAPVNELGWEIYPEGFYRTLKAVQQRFPGKPILITENGIADGTDRSRVEFLRSHLAALHQALEEGVPVEAYCHWSLMDNFEWIEGFAPRFGLYEVNYSTMERKPRESARFFADIAAKNSVSTGSGSR